MIIVLGQKDSFNGSTILWVWSSKVQQKEFLKPNKADTC